MTCVPYGRNSDLCRLRPPKEASARLPPAVKIGRSLICARRRQPNQRRCGGRKFQKRSLRPPPRRARSLTRRLVVSAAPPIGRRFRKLAHFLERLQSYGVRSLRQYSTGSAMLALPSSPSCVRLPDLRSLRSQPAFSPFVTAGGNLALDRGGGRIARFRYL